MPDKPSPPVVVCAPRSSTFLASVIDGLQLETNERYRPEVFEGMGRRSKCNKAAEDFCTAMSVHLPKGLLALGQIAWLNSSASRAEGWFLASQVIADAFADNGCPVLVGWTNPDPKQSSHIAFMRKAKTIAQAGASNFSSGSVANGFGNRVVQYFCHL